MDDIAIKVDHVSKTFKLPHEKNNSIKSAVVNFYRRKRTFETQEVLNDVSFEIKKGEFFGIVGRNGSGKSTLLKMLAGIYTPTKGNIQVNGKLTPFIELGVGFNPELTGRENVFLNGALLGFNRKEMAAMYDDIVAFAELERFMDQKLKNYSSGMQVRLAFSIAIQAKSEILLIDEVLAVGDVSFQEKCFEVFREIKKSKRTVIFVSHDLNSVQEFCDTAALVDQNKLVRVGAPEQIVLEYETRMADSTSTPRTVDKTNRPGSGELRVEKVSVLNSKNEPTASLKEGEEFILEILYKQKETVENLVCGVSINDVNDISIMGPNTQESKVILTPDELKTGNAIRAQFNDNPLSAGTYTVTVGLFNGKGTNNPYDFYSKATSFKVLGRTRHGKVTIEPEWSIIKTSK